MENEWNNVKEVVEILAGEFGQAPTTAIVLGSGLGNVTRRLEDGATLPADRVTGWPVSTVAGHAGALHVGNIQGKRTLIIEGRVHLYEGYSPAMVVRPVRSAIAWGVKTIILTNAAGALNSKFKPGQIMAISDHINLTGQSPLVGPSDVIPGPRFPDLSDLYSSDLRKQALECAAKLGIDLAEGVYAGMLGPSYETAAEVRMLAGFGAQAVGMSTVIEAIAACHLGAKVAGFSTLTNLATGLKGAILDHKHVQEVGAKASEDLGRLVESLVAEQEG